MQRAKQLADKSSKQMELSYNEVSLKVESLTVLVSEYASTIGKCKSENASLMAQLDEAQLQIDGIARIRQQYQQQVDEAKRHAEDEARNRMTLSQHLKNMTMDFESVKAQYEEEVCWPSGQMACFFFS